jgi:phosphoglycolate phosphatase-like HAD superfamily hydrolase
MDLEPGPDIWFVGDTIADYLAAKAAKCTPIMVGEHHGQAHMKSHQHVGELREIYESLN